MATPGISPRWRWVERIDDSLGDRIVALMNKVVAAETTIGFVDELNAASGRAVIAGLREEMEKKHFHLMLAEAGDRVIAHCILAPQTLPTQRHLACIYRAMVDPEERGKGLVIQGLRNILEKCDALGIEKLFLDVRRGTRAAEIWTALGFAEFGVLTDYARTGNVRHDGLYMQQTVEVLRKRVPAV